MSIDEEYIHFRESVDCLNRSWRTICELEKEESGSAIWSAAYRMALIEYCKPFKISYGNEKRKHSLPTPKIAEPLLSLHNTVMSLRDKVLAHSDINILNASVYRVPETISPIPLVVTNLLNEWPEPGEIRKLLEAVLDHVYELNVQYKEHYQKKP